ncbi:hypothetical protein [Mesorhizobium sp. ES1-4]|uniref:hypothetical protein n=1 Tax=Mesorhizobium sp. ES1-4 TaxID=2876627 RepID=UPI001CCD26B4|nr:hypothetical protein [Mesorhizobium sp. ES1-4]MBZ9798716.1 hypothetical protein [Mesorhizobium sp. ES1-4]
MSAKAHFNELRRELRVPLDDLARILRRPFGTVKAWASDNRPNLIPPADVVAAMEAELVGRAMDRIRAAGFDVFRRKAA